MIPSESVPWVLDDHPYPVAHVSLSNLPIHERTEGVTLCHKRADLVRLPSGVPIPGRIPCCRVCEHELARLDHG